MNGFFFIKKIIVFEIEILIFLSLIILCIGLYVSIKTKNVNNKKRVFEKVLQEVLKQRIPFFKEILPSKCVRLNVVIPVLEKYDQIFKEPFFSFVKEILIHDFMRDQLLKAIHGKNRWKKIWGFRALNLSPKQEYQEDLVHEINKQATFEHFLMIPYVITTSSKQVLQKYLERLVHESEAMQIFSMDALFESKETTLSFVKEIYEESNSKEIRLICLKVLCKKTGFLSMQALQKDLSEQELQNQWWAIRSLANIPSKETTQVLSSFLNHPHWQIRALACFILGKIGDKSILPLLLEKLSDENEWVKIAAVFALSHFDEGKKHLDEMKKYQSMLLFTSFEKNLDVIANYLP